MDIFNSSPKNAMTFNHRGTPIDPELRPLWRISLIALILFKICSGNKANSKKIQVLYSLVASEKKRRSYRLIIEKEELNLSVNVRFDPLVDRAVDIALGEEIFILDASKSIKLTEKGLGFVKKIDSDSSIFTLEKDFLKLFSKSHFSEKVIDSLITGGLS
ncbi:hypothetical protein [Vreelandella sulfidaeris]|uniref:hypothetical protein n=1 Tax=Vreelandella sulfidaeris TaxID=115553 RepID=UPI0035E8CBBA